MSIKVKVNQISPKQLGLHLQLNSTFILITIIIISWLLVHHEGEKLVNSSNFSLHKILIGDSSQGQDTWRDVSLALYFTLMALKPGGHVPMKIFQQYDGDIFTLNVFRSLESIATYDLFILQLQQYE